MTETLEELRPHDAVAQTPWWFERIVGALASALIGYGLIGMLLAQLGWFRIGPVLALGTALSYSVFVQLFPAGATSRRSVAGTRPALAAIAIGILSLAFNWTTAAETMLTDGEPGVMVNAARHRHGLVSSAGTASISSGKASSELPRAGQTTPSEAC